MVLGRRPGAAAGATFAGRAADRDRRYTLDRAGLREERSGDDATPDWHRLHATLDPSDEHLAFVDAARATVENRRVVDPVRDPGPFSDAWRSLALVAEHRYSSDSPGLERAWAAWTRTTSADAGPPGLVSPDTPLGRRGLGGRAAARIVMERGGAARYSTHPLWPALERLRSDRKYDGVEHLEAARKLESQGEALLAWGAIESAASFAVTMGRRSAIDAFEAARELAARQSWETITEHLDRISNARKNA